MKKKVLKDYSDMCIFDLMKVPTEELKELTIEEFAEEIRTKKVNIHPFTNDDDSATHGNIYITGIDVTIHITFRLCLHRLWPVQGFHIRVLEKYPDLSINMVIDGMVGTLIQPFPDCQL